MTGITITLSVTTSTQVHSIFVSYVAYLSTVENIKGGLYKF